MTERFGFVLDRDAVRKVYVKLRAFPRTTHSTCACGITHTQSSLKLYPTCEHCGEYDKIYNLGAGIELQSLIEMILGWAGIPKHCQESVPIHPEDFPSEDWTHWDKYFDVTPEEIEAERDQCMTTIE